MSTNKLKIIALIFMIIDHIHYFIPNSPKYFYCIGRVSAPIFFFCMALGYYYTKSKRKFLIRLYLFGSIMAMINMLINYIVKEDVYLNNNIFMTLFISSVIIWIIELYRKDKRKGQRYAIIFIFMQMMSTSVIIVGEIWSETFISLRELIGALTANIFFCEGGIAFVILPVILYLIKDKKKSLIYGYCLYCAMYTLIYITDLVPRIIIYSERYLPEWMSMIAYLIARLINADYLPAYNQAWYILKTEQWLMILALPFMVLYNGKRGGKCKYFFYLFYPIHIYVLYIIGALINN